MKIYFDDIKFKVSSDFEGNFIFKIFNDFVLNNVIINYSGIMFYIIYCLLEFLEKLDLGKVIFLKYK